MKYKGQFISTTTILAMFFVASSTVFGSQVAVQEFNRDLEFNSGDLSKITQTKVKVEAFEDRAPKEVNFTVNNISMRKVNWRGDPPSIDEAKSTYLANLNEVMGGQLSVLGCSSPDVESVELGESLTEYKVELSGESINCVSESTEVRLPTDLGSSFKVNHPNNRYISALNYTSNYTRNLKDNLDSASLSTSDSDSSSCEGGSMFDTKSDAKSDAKSDVLKDIKSIAEDENKDGDEFNVGWISLNADSVDITGSCSYETNSESCQYRDGCAETDENGTCVEPAYSEGTIYSAKCDWSTSEVLFELSILDSEYEIVTSDGEANPEFKWDYTYVN